MLALAFSFKAVSSIDHCTVSVAILDVGQSQQKLQQMYGILFNFQRL